ncbi:MAG: S9 family peptidase [bacterium]
MSIPQSSPYGSWKSPITSDMIVQKSVKLGQVVLDGGQIYWNEMRPDEAGRNVVVTTDANGQLWDVISSPFNARTRVHEYGGGAFTVHDGVVYFTNDEDQQLYRLTHESSPIQLTHESHHRFADLLVDARRNRLLCIREDHSHSGQEVVNTIVALPLTGQQASEVLVSGNDFYASPCLSPDGRQLAWLTWNHPNMPWDGTELWLGELDTQGAVSQVRKIAGGQNESIFQPQWSPEGTLYFISDRSNWWNLYRFQANRVQRVLEKDAEFGLPQWVFGMSTYAFVSENELICTYFENGDWHLARLHTPNGQLQIIETPFTFFEEIRASGEQVVFLAAAPIMSKAVVQLDLNSLKFNILRKSSELTVDTTFISRPQAVEFPTENDLTAYAYYYPPQNRDYEAPEGERPPLIVKSHGGPTGTTASVLEMKIQYWTSRGFAVLDVNYGGSTGYGREFRQRLNGKWGIVDVADCVNGAKYLVQKELVDRERIAITGGSAGGYTTLCALTFHNFFRAGASYYGISDLEALAKDTHKFESHYLDKLIGKYPEQREIYLKRSPIHFTDALSCPVIIFQGLEDKVVPPNQAEMMVAALRKKGLPVAYIPFAGEQHGLRRAENIKRSLEAELYFYSKIFQFDLMDDIPAIKIDNL